MPIEVLDAAGLPKTVETGNANGRAAASASKPVALSNEDKAAIDAIVTALGPKATSADLAAIAALLADASTGADIATVVSALTSLAAALETIDLGASTLTALETIELGATTLAALESINVAVTGGATLAKQDETITAINGLVGTEYEYVPAGATNQVLGAAGAVGDLLVSLLITPATTSPGIVQVKDGSGTAITVFVGGPSSVGTLHPFTVQFGIKSTSGAWQVTTGASVSAIASGNFT